jgi:hypothetical protein
MALAVAAALLLAACQPMPKPFQPADKRAPGQLAVEISPRAGLVIADISGLADDNEAQHLREELGKALRRRDIVASTGTGHSGSHWLYGDVAVDAGQVDASWSILAPDGRVIEEIAFQSRLAGWKAGGDGGDPAKEIAAETARRIDAALRRREGDDRQFLELPPVSLAAITGVPEHGQNALAGAMVRSLAALGLRVDADPAADGYVIRAQILRLPKPPTQEHVSIAWSVYDSRGQEIGRVEQGNDVPVGRLDRSWGGLAHDIADNAAHGIIDLLRRQRANDRAG